MKMELKNAVRNAIKESELNGHKWTATKDGLKWSYGVEFIFRVSEADGDTYIEVIDKCSGLRAGYSIVGANTAYCDSDDLANGFFLATRRAIRCANRTY